MTTRELVLFVLILIVNAIIAVIYLIIGLIKWNGKEKQQVTDPEKKIPKDEKKAYIIKFFVMLLCPVVGILFFAIGHLLFLFLFWRDVDLEDVIFSKERVKTYERPDEDQERSLAPLEEAIAVSDKESLRNLMLIVVRDNIQKSLAFTSLALNSPDSETSHYAASVLQDELNDFRMYVQKIINQIEMEEEEETEYEHMLFPYMNTVLEQKVLTDMEQNNMVDLFVRTGEKLYQKAPEQMTGEYYNWICMRLLDIRDFERMEVWCGRAAEQYPEELSSYTCKLKLYFTAQDKKNFFATMDELKQSGVIIDRETLEMIRTFS